MHALGARAPVVPMVGPVHDGVGGGVSSWLQPREAQMDSEDRRQDHGARDGPRGNKEAAGQIQAKQAARSSQCAFSREHAECNSQ